MSWTDLTQLPNLVAWYKPETLAAAYANGDPISTWADSSGNGIDLTSSSTARPTALANALNGYMGADFDGTDDVLASSSYTQSGNVVASFVSQISSTKQYQTLLTIDTSSPPVYRGDWLCLLTNNDLLNIMRDNPAGSMYVNRTQANILTCAVTDLGYLGRQNGQEKNRAGNTPTSPSSGTAYIYIGDLGSPYTGTTYLLDGFITEMVIYTSTDYHEVPWVEGYLSHKYGLTLFDGHLFKNDPPSLAPPQYNPSGGLLRVGLNGGM